MLKTDFFEDCRFPAVLFHEPELPTGFPDVVVVYLSSKNVAPCRPRMKLRERHIRVLHFLYIVGRTRMNDAADALRMRVRELSSIVKELHAAELVNVRGEVIRPKRLSEIFGVSQIVAIEAKMRNWPRALMQAAANRWFASHSYILLPRIGPISKVLKEARKLGVGVLVFDDDAVTVALKPKVRKLPGSYGSWLLNEWALRVGREIA